MRHILERHAPRLSALIELENLHVERDPLGRSHPIIVREVCKGSFFSFSQRAARHLRRGRTIVGVACGDCAIPGNFKLPW